MAVTAVRSTVVTLSGDVSANLQFDAANNIVSPGSLTIQNLELGDNTIVVPVADSIVVTAVTIIPPEDNEEVIILKGDSADVGINLHPSDPTTIALAVDTVNFMLTVAADINDVRFCWT